MCALSLVPSVSSGQDGALDPTFGVGGLVATDFAETGALALRLVRPLNEVMVMDWVLASLHAYWPVILIAVGIGSLIYGVSVDETAVGVVSLLVYGGLGTLFFFRTPAQIWVWLSQFEIIEFLVSGTWYEVALKVTGAIGAVGLALRFLFGVLSSVSLEWLSHACARFLINLQVNLTNRLPAAGYF